MRTHTRITVLFILILALLPARPMRAEGPGNAVPNVVIITISSVRSQDTVADPQMRYIPHLSKELFPQGLLYSNLVDTNCQFHMPVVGAINTGHDYDLFTTIDAPSLFQYVRKAHGWPRTKVWAVGEWNRQSSYETEQFPSGTFPCTLNTVGVKPPEELKGILNEQETAFFARYDRLEENADFQWPVWDSINEVQHRVLKKIFREFKPKLVHYVMNNAEAAHYGTFGRYLVSVVRADEMIKEIWDIIRHDPFYRDTTYLFVSPDHQRNAYYMDHLENPPQDPSRVWLYVYGPGIPAGARVDRPVHHRDIFPTVARLMHTEVGPHDGEVLKELFP